MPLDRMHESFWEVARQLAPRPGRFEFTTRLALICAVTVLVVEIYQTPDPALTVYVAFFLSRDSRTMSLIIDIVFVALITLLIGFIVLVAMVVINDPMWRAISMSVISIGILFVSSASKLRPLGGTIALIVGYGLDLLGTTPLGIGEVATRSLLYAWLFVGIPAGVSMVVNLLLAPALVYPIKKIACNAGRPLQAFILISVSWPLFYSAARRARIRSPLIASVGGSMGLIEMLQAADFRRDVSRQAVARAIKHSVGQTPPVAVLRRTFCEMWTETYVMSSRSRVHPNPRPDDREQSALMRHGLILVVHPAFALLVEALRDRGSSR
jgi:hypothetical protein